MNDSSNNEDRVEESNEYDDEAEAGKTVRHTMVEMQPSEMSALPVPPFLGRQVVCQPSVELNPLSFPKFGGSPISTYSTVILSSWEVIQGEFEYALKKVSVIFQWSENGLCLVQAFYNNKFVDLAVIFYREPSQENTFIVDFTIGSTSDRTLTNEFIGSTFSSVPCFKFAPTKQSRVYDIPSLDDLDLDMDFFASAVREETLAACNSLRSGKMESIEFGLDFSVNYMNSEPDLIAMENVLSLVDAVCQSVSLYPHPLSGRFFSGVSIFLTAEVFIDHSSIPQELHTMINVMQQIVDSPSCPLLCRRECLQGLLQLASVQVLNQLISWRDFSSPESDPFLLQSKGLLLRSLP